MPTTQNYTKRKFCRLQQHMACIMVAVGRHNQWELVGEGEEEAFHVCILGGESCPYCNNYCQLAETQLLETSLKYQNSGGTIVAMATSYTFVLSGWFGKCVNSALIQWCDMTGDYLS